MKDAVYNKDQHGYFCECGNHLISEEYMNTWIKEEFKRYGYMVLHTKCDVCGSTVRINVVHLNAEEI